ncbi:MAG: type II secretion system protein [Granulosicoccus sp.]
MRRRRKNSGFTLIEMAMVLLILGLLTRAAIMPLTSVIEHRKQQAVDTQLQQIRQAMLSHLVAYGALPCPVAMTHGGLHRLPTTPDLPSGEVTAMRWQPCLSHQGGVPAVPLGLSGALSSSSALLDPWGQEYIYSVSLNSTTVDGELGPEIWTTPGTASHAGLSQLYADIKICSKPSRNGCPASRIRADQIAFLVLSPGEDNSSRGFQAENLDGDQDFVLLPDSVAPHEQFDDRLVWGTASEMAYWLLRMGWLP